VRFLLEFDSDDDGRVSGQVSADGAQPAGFDGWVQLLRLLEDHAHPRDGRQVPEPGRDGQESA